MMIDIVCPVIVASRTRSWTTIYFARNYDLKAGSVKDRLQVARPTLFLGVPLVWEKIADQIRAIGAEVTGLARFVADWSKGLSLERAKAAQLGGDGYTPAGHSL